MGTRADDLHRAGRGRRLPAPDTEGDVSVEEALARRRSVRAWSGRPLKLAHVGQLLWAAQGITDRQGLRTAPSAGALYPLEVLLLARRVDGLETGIYRYRPEGHGLEPIEIGSDHDHAAALARAAVDQTWIARAPAVLILGGVEARTAAKYGPRASRYVHVEAGAAAENVALQAVGLGLASVVVGAFDDREVARLLHMEAGETPLVLLPVGHR